METREARDVFSTCHPIVNMAYFVFVIAFSVVFTHPLCLALACLCAAFYALYLGGKRVLRFFLTLLLPALAVTVGLNVAFNHEGGTILTYFGNGNPLTLESVAYGAAAAAMLLSVFGLCVCVSAVMTSDKLICLFGRVLPSLSLVLSMALRFAPRFGAQLAVIANAQRGIGRDVSRGGPVARARNGVRILSIMVTWALENAIETADSMKGRGYGLPGRTAFSVFTFGRRDARALAVILICGAYILAGAWTGGLYFRYFPTIKGTWSGAYTISLLVSYFVLFATPAVMNAWEGGRRRARARAWNERRADEAKS